MQIVKDGRKCKLITNMKPSTFRQGSQKLRDPVHIIMLICPLDML